MRLSLGLGLNKGGSRLPRFITDIFNLLQSSPTYTGGPLTATDYLGNLVTSPAGTPALEGGRLTDGAWHDTELDGTPIQPSISIPTRSGTKKWYQEPFANPFGYSNWPARTNKCTCRKFNPVDTTNIAPSGGGTTPTNVEVVASISELADAGLSNICTNGNVYRMSASDAVGFNTLGGSTGNTNNHSISMYARAVSGTGRIYIESAYATITSNAFARVVLNNTISGATFRQLIVRADVNSTIEYILPQLEEGAFATPPIFDPLNDSLTSITRAATNLSLPTAGVLPVNDFGIWGEVITGSPATQNDAYFVSTHTDTSNYFGVRTANAGLLTYLTKTIGGAAFQITAGVIPAITSPFQYQVFQSRVYGMGIRVKEQGGAWSAWTLKNDADGRLDAPIAATYQVGTKDSAAYYAGYYPSLAIIQHADPKAELERLTLKYGA
jgi:hypothetical protein